MAVKTISLLESFDNKNGDNILAIGGQLRFYDDSNTTENDKNSAAAKETLNPQTSADALVFNSKTYNQALFEISQPSHTGLDGRPLLELEYTSKKITYEDLVKNIILDTKAYLNTRNNLGEFNLCAIVFDQYLFSGDKTFLSNINISQDLNVQGDTNITGFTTIHDNLHVLSNITADLDINAGRILSAGGALYTATLSSDSTGTTINPVQNGFIIINVLTATSDNITISKPVIITNNLSAIDGKFTGDLDVTGNINASDINASNINASKIYCTGLSCAGTTADLTAAHALWSDLAEYYLADNRYEPGTLMQFGGENEVTIAKDKVNAVVTSKPAYLMNAGLKDNPLGCPLALAGRVPVKVIGKVKKFDKVVLSSTPGVTRAKKWYDFFVKTIGRALESNDNDDVKLVECVTGFII